MDKIDKYVQEKESRNLSKVEIDYFANYDINRKELNDDEILSCYNNTVTYAKSFKKFSNDSGEYIFLSFLVNPNPTKQNLGTVKCRAYGKTEKELTKNIHQNIKIEDSYHTGIVCEIGKWYTINCDNIVNLKEVDVNGNMNKDVEFEEENMNNNLLEQIEYDTRRNILLNKIKNEKDPSRYDINLDDYIITKTTIKDHIKQIKYCKNVLEIFFEKIICLNRLLKINNKYEDVWMDTYVKSLNDIGVDTDKTFNINEFDSSNETLQNLINNFKMLNININQFDTINDNKTIIDVKNELLMKYVNIDKDFINLKGY